MAKTESQKVLTFEAAGDLSAGLYLGVKQNSSSQVVVATTLGQAITGVLCNKPAAAGRPASVAVAGIVKVKAGAACTAGTKATVMANGRFQNAASGHHVCGEFVTGGVDGDIIELDMDSAAKNMLLP
jgi:hypothetical protein